MAQERDRVIDENATIERENEELARWQTRVRFTWPEPEKIEIDPEANPEEV